MTAENPSVMDGQTGLPNQKGWEALLEAEEMRSRRHGGVHGLVLVRLGAVKLSEPERVAVAIVAALREIDLVARVDHQTFGVLALHCVDLESVVARLRAGLEQAGAPLDYLVNAQPAGADLRATWTAMFAGRVVEPKVQHLPFVASARLSPN